MIESWKADAEKDATLAARVNWLSHRPGEELYDLETDPYETKNLAENTDLDEIKNDLRAALDAWMVQQGDKGMETELIAKTRQGPRRQKNAAAKKNTKKKKLP